MLLALPAAAHDSLVDSEPAAEEVVTTAPGELVLRFSGEVSELGVQFVVTGPEGRDVVQGIPTVEGDTVRQELAEELVNGDYEATWRVTSSDGHPISGTLMFTIEAADAEPPEDSTSTDAPTGESTPTQEPGDSTPTQEPGESTPTQEPGDSTPTQEPTTDAAPGPDATTSAPGAGDVDEPTETGDDAETATEATEAAEADPTEASGGIPAWGWLVAVVAAIGLVACGFLAFRRN